MKIIFGIDYISRKNTGISSVVENLSDQLTKRGHTTHIAAIEDAFSQTDKIKFESSLLELFSSGTGPVHVLKTLKKYTDFFLRSDADLAHIHSLWSISTIAVYFWSLRTKRPYVISTNGMLNEWALNQSKFKKEIFLGIIFRKIITGSYAIIVNSKAEQNYLKENSWHNRFFIIPNGVNIPATTEVAVKKHPSSKKLLFLSRIHVKKGIELLLDAWANLYSVTTEKKWELDVVGFLDPEGNEYEKYIAGRIRTNPNLANVIISEGKFGKEMWDAYQSSDAFILPTFSEGSAMVVLNAWTTGKLCLTTIGSNLEKGLNEPCTILIEPTVDSIQRGIEKLVNLSDMEIIEHGQIGKQIVRENYTWDKITDANYEVYEDAINHSK